jgi:halocarboxylic acid dehydrogenase DehI
MPPIGKKEAARMNSSAAHSASEVLEEYAEGDIKGIFDDIKKTLRVPVVNAVFGALATEPDYLRVAWRQLHTNAQTVYFESRADDLRRFAVISMSEIGELRTPASDDSIEGVLDVFHYVGAKLLLAIAALRSSMLGQLPRAVMLPGAEKRQVVPGVAPGMPTIEMVHTDTRDERLQRIFGDITSASPAGVLGSEYRALAKWPDYLDGAWSAVKPRMFTPAYRRATRQLRWMADEAVLGLPFRVEATPHTLRHAGLSERQIDHVRTMLDQFYRDISHSVANVAVFATGIEGRSGALENRYPVELV